LWRSIAATSASVMASMVEADGRSGVEISQKVPLGVVVHETRNINDNAASV
jgi:hypothetical protein